MDIAAILREEIERRGLTATDISRETGLPFSTASEFLRGVRMIGSDKASRIAAFLGFDLVISKIRRRSMETYLETVNQLQDEGIPMDDETVEQVTQYVEDLRYLEENCPGWNETDVEQTSGLVADLEWLEEHGWNRWGEDDAEQASQLRADLEWLEEHGWNRWGEDDAEQASQLRADLEWLEEHGWNRWGEDDAEQVSQFVADLKQLEEWGENPDPARMQEVADFVRNLREMDEG